ncbi:unnamed protein product, partial [Allacma fusca]
MMEKQLFMELPAGSALAESIRWVFKLADVEFEDERIELEDWPSVKKSG